LRVNLKGLFSSILEFASLVRGVLLSIKERGFAKHKKPNERHHGMFKHATPQPPFPSRDLVEPLRVPVDRENVMYMINGMSRAVDKHFARERENEIRMQESDVSIEESGENTEHSIISVSEVYHPFLCLCSCVGIYLTLY